MLSDKIEEWMNLADKRNLSKENPVTLIVKNAGQDFWIIVSILEPNRVTLPFNVTWIVADTESVNFGRALRRASALPSQGFRNTWAQLQTEEDIYGELQFWDVSTSFQLGEISVSEVGPASENVRGLFALQTAAPQGEDADPVVVGDNDPRMSDARQPTPHTHALLPAIALHGAEGINEFSVIINGGNSPTPGQILVINSISLDENDEQVVRGSWQTPLLADVEYNGPTFDELVITTSLGDGIDTVDEDVTVVFSATANFSNGPQGNVPVLWSIIAGTEYGNINASTGVFNSNDITGDKLIRVRAEWTHVPSNTTRTATFDLNVIDVTVTAVLQSIEIQGVGNLNEGNNTASYVVVATYDDNSTQAIVPVTFTSSNSGAGTLNPTTGIFTSATNVSSNQLTTLSATYSENGVTVSDTHNLTVIDTTVYPASAVILGPDQVSENTTETYQLSVTFTDGSSSVVAVSNWSLSNSAAGTINATTGVLTAPTNLDATENAIVSASFTSNGVPVSATKNIQVTDDTVYPISAVILGSSAINEGTNTTFQMQVTYSNNNVQVVSVSDWATSNPTAGAINTTTGVFTAAADITSNQTTIISASYTAAGETVSATRNLAVNDITNYPISLLILGNASMNEGTTQTLTARVTYSDNSTALVPVAYTSSNPSAATVGANSGIVTAVTNIQSAVQTVISAAYTEHGTTVNATFNITVQDITVYPASAIIQGITTVSEGTTATYQLRVTYTNGSQSLIPVTNWAVSTSSAGTISSSGVLTAPANVTVDVPAVITASYTLDGVTVNGSLNITVTDETVYPATATIIGPNSVDEGETLTYTLRVDFSDATHQTVTVSDWASSNTNVATIGSSSGIFTALDVTENSDVEITASYTSAGTTVNASLDVTVADTTVYPATAAIIGPASIDENTTQNYIFRVTFSDESVQDLPITNWATTNSVAGIINASTGAFQAAANVPENTVTTLSGSYTAEGQTVNATLQLTVVDVTAYPVSAAITGVASVNEGGSTTYVLNVTFTNGSTAARAATDWASSNPAAGTIDAETGVFTATANVTGASLTTTITASHTVDDETAVGSRVISVVDTTVYPTSAEIVGATNLSEDSTTQLQLRVNYSNSTQQFVIADSWTNSNVNAGALSGTLTDTVTFTSPSNIIANQNTTIGASYTSNGVTVTDTHSLSVIDTILRPVSAAVLGPNNMLETGANSTFQLQVTFDNGSTQVVSVTDWARTNAAAGAINATTGVFTPANVTATTTTDITASYTAQGVTVTGTKTGFAVIYLKRPVSAIIQGSPTAHQEGGAATNYQLRVTFDDGTNDIYATNNWALSNPLAGTLGASSGQFLPAANVTAVQNANITASYTENGATATGTLAISVANTVNRVVSGEILGVASIDEGNTTTFQFRATYEDGTTSIVNPTNWASSNTAAATIVASTGVLTALDISADANTTISASFTFSGNTVSDTHVLAVVADVSSAGPRARWGVAQFSDVDLMGGKTQPNMAGTQYEIWTGPQQFITDELTNIQNNAGPYQLNLLVPYEPAPMYGYFAHPKSMGIATFTDDSTGAIGGWDGMSWQDLEIGETFGPLTYTYNDGNGPEDWYVYRLDFSGIDNWDGTVTIAPE